VFRCDRLRPAEPVRAFANVGTNQYETVPNSSDRLDQFTVRIDDAINDRQHLTGYYYFDDSSLFLPFSTYQASGANLPGFGGKFAIRNQQASLTYTWVISPTTVNEARFGFYREGESQLNAPERTNLVQDSCKSVPSSQCFSDPQNPRLGITPGIPASLGASPTSPWAEDSPSATTFKGKCPKRGTPSSGRTT
jgi:hypothetical protein